MAVAYTGVGVTACVILSFLSRTVIAATPTLTISPKEAKVGDKITFTCKLSTSGSGAVQLIKLNPTVEPTHSIIVSTNYDLSRQYAKYSRWSSSIQISDTDKTVTATLDAASAEDAGPYKCNHGSQGSEDVVLQIIVPVTDVYVTARNRSGAVETFRDGDTITYEMPNPNSPVPVSQTSYRDLRLIAFVNGSNIMPSKTVTIGKEVVTNAFYESVQESKRATKYQENGLADFSVEVQYAWTKGSIHHYTGKQLTFSAQVKDTPKKSVQVTLNILFFPQVMCQNSSYAFRGASAEIMCTVSANPFSNTRMYWRLKDGATLQNGDSRGVFTASDTEIDSYTRRVSLKISATDSQHFGQYLITAKKGSYESTANTDLIETTQGAIGSAVRLKVGMASILFAVMSLVCLQESLF